MIKKGVGIIELEAYNRRQQINMRRIQQLRLFDDDFMTKCFEDSPACTELLLRVILNKQDLKVEEVHTQHTVKNLQGRSVKLDIFAVDSAQKRYNIEVQRDSQGAGPRRARYHSSLMDANILLAGDDTENLPESYVIFITEHDVFGRGQAVFHARRTMEGTEDLFADGSHILYVNGAYRGESPVGKLMHDFSCTNPGDMNYALLAERVRYFKGDKEGVRTMCRIWEEVRDEGWVEGLKEGAMGNLLANIKALMETMGFTVEQAMDALQVPEEDRAGVISSISAS